jgi:predicted nicotinamide N-methyase
MCRPAAPAYGSRGAVGSMETAGTGAAAGPGSPAFIRATTRLTPVPLVPEIGLHLAAEPIEAWQRTEHALGQTGLPPPYWAFAWPGGQALGRYLLDHPRVVAGKRVIDLASGSGLVAIAAARAGAVAVAAYDVDPLAVAAIAVNAAANHVSVTGVCADILSPGGPPRPPADLVLVADAFYQRELAASVMSFLDGARDTGAGVLAADLGRAYLPTARLTALAAYDVPGLAAIEDHDVRTTTIWALRR